MAEDIRSTNSVLEKFSGVFESLTRGILDQTNILTSHAIAQESFLKNISKNITITDVGDDIVSSAYVDTLSGIEKIMLSNNGILSDILDINQKQLNFDIEKAEKDALQSDLLSVNQSLGENRQSKIQATGVSETTGADFTGLGGILSSLSVALGTAIGSILAGLISPAIIARYLIRGGIITFMLPWVSEFVHSFTMSALENVDINDALKDEIGEATSSTAWGAALGVALGGRRLLIVGAAAGFMSSFADNLLNFLGLDAESTVELFGQEFSAENIAEAGLGAGGVALAGLLQSTAPLRVKLGATIGTAVLMAYISYADELKGWIEEQEFPAPVAAVATAGVDILGMAATGASFGMMFGVQGALVGAAIGLALGVGKTLYNWIKERQQKAAEDALKRTEEAYNILERGGEDARTASEIAATSDAELARQRETGELPVVSPEISTAANILRSQRETSIDSVIEKLEETGIFQAGAITSDSLRETLRNLQIDDDPTQNEQINTLIGDLRDIVGLQADEIELLLSSISSIPNVALNADLPLGGQDTFPVGVAPSITIGGLPIAQPTALDRAEIIASERSQINQRLIEMETTGLEGSPEYRELIDRSEELFQEIKQITGSQYPEYLGETGIRLNDQQSSLTIPNAIGTFDQNNIIPVIPSAEMLNTLEKAAQQATINYINNTPVTYAPVTNNVTGPTNVSNSNRSIAILGNGSNPTALPGGMA